MAYCLQYYVKEGLFKAPNERSNEPEGSKVMHITTNKLVTGVFVLLLSTNAVAIPISCDTSIANNVTSSNTCQLGSTNNDFLNPLQVNVDEMFGFDDWQFGQKAFDGDMDIDFGLSILGGTISGSWSINDVWGSYSDVMIVLKGGAGNNTVTSYVGYLLTQESISGTYLTPFANANNGNPKNISHMSIYARGPAVLVSEPAILVLLFAGMFGIGFAHWRKR